MYIHSSAATQVVLCDWMKVAFGFFAGLSTAASSSSRLLIQWSHPWSQWRCSAFCSRLWTWCCGGRAEPGGCNHGPMAPTAAESPKAGLRSSGVSLSSYKPLEVQLLGGSGDLVTTYNWLYNPNCSLPKWPYMAYSFYKEGYKPI